MRVLVLGGYGNFGARIVRALSGDASIDLLVGGRDPARGIALDHRARNLAERLRALGVELLIHAAGPFQHQACHVAAAAAAAGAHYIDLADGRRFVCDFASSMDHAFRAAGRSAISGASTVPALSSAVVEHLARGWQRIDMIDLCIAPAQTAPRGTATLEAVLGYCGEKVAVWDEGRWTERRGWARPVRVEFARLAPRLGALCDIPDLELFPARYAVTQRVMFRAAQEVALGQRVFAALAALRARGWIDNPARWARALDRSARVFDRFGSALGGMVVRVQGEDADGHAQRRSWHIAADHDHGPEIPCMAAILLARRLASGESLPIGAMPCMGLLALDDFAPEFARWQMATDLIGEEVGA